jgi:uncharacterized protein YbdZ (MbtH family)
MMRRVGKIATYVAVVAVLMMPVAVALAGPAIALAGPTVTGEQAERIGTLGLVGAIMESIASTNTGVDEAGQYTVMADSAGGFMIWPSSEPRPAGWHAVSATGSRAECLAYIEASLTGAHIQ